MKEYFEFFLLALLIVIIYKVPDFMCRIANTKFLLLSAIIFNAYILKKFGVTSAITFAVILAIILNKSKVSVPNMEGFTPKISKWAPSNFSSPCQIDLDRKMKVNSEKANMESTKQIDEHTNGGFNV